MRLRRQSKSYTPNRESDDFGIYVGKRNVEGGPRSNNFSNDGFRLVTGTKGEINDQWSYDASYLYAQTRQNSTYINDFFAPNITAVLNSDACDNGCPGYSVFRQVVLPVSKLMA
jgi:iron complex outermembrane receptor protein